MKTKSYVVNHQYLPEQTSHSWVSTPTRTSLRPTPLRTSWQSRRNRSLCMLIPKRETKNRWRTLVLSPNTWRRRWEERYNVELDCSRYLMDRAKIVPSIKRKALDLYVMHVLRTMVKLQSTCSSAEKKWRKHKRNMTTMSKNEWEKGPWNSSRIKNVTISYR